MSKAIASRPVSVRSADLPPTSTQAVRAALDIALTTLEDNKAEDVTVIDLVGKTSIADAMVIASGRSTRQVGSLAEHLVEKLKQAGIKPVATEGKTQADWVLIDAGDLIIHLFRPEIRAFYNIEKMWGVDSPPSTVAPS
ncbi:MAG: ribosome silencing factor [Pseudomonadota bacterium]